MTITWIANHLLFINIGWYVVLAVAFGLAQNRGMTLYWIGAALLSYGVYLTNMETQT